MCTCNYGEISSSGNIRLTNGGAGIRPPETAGHPIRHTGVAYYEIHRLIFDGGGR